MSLSRFQPLFDGVVEPTRYPADCQRIARIAREAGLSIANARAEKIWDWYSDMYAAGWLGLPDEGSEGDAEIGGIIEWYCETLERSRSFR